MKKTVIIISVIVIAIVGGILLWKTANDKKVSEKNNNELNYQAERSSTNQNSNISSNNTNNENKSEISNGTNSNINNTATNNASNNVKTTNQEKAMAEFSTKIYTKDAERQNNISITCKSLTNKSVKPGETFSFCNTVGKATTAKGYQEADIYVDGKKRKRAWRRKLSSKYNII